MSLQQVCQQYFQSTDIPSLNRVVLDARLVSPGDIFVAIKGQCHNGHDFIQLAIEKGACLVIGTESRPFPQHIYKRVCDQQKTLYELACIYRQYLSQIVAITGSVGKTTTKDMLKCCLAAKYTVAATDGNQNNELGVPLTILNCPTHMDYLIVEMGAKRQGDIAYLMDCVRPNISILTTVADAHMASFGSLECIAKTKSEILAPSGHTSEMACYDADLADLYQWHTSRIAMPLGMHLSGDGSYQFTPLGATQYTLSLVVGQDTYSWTVSICGQHLLHNLVKAIRVAMACGVGQRDIEHALNSLPQSQGRMFMRDIGDLTVCDDTYNASPQSVSAGIDEISKMPGKKAFVFGQMAECGEHEVMLHCKLLEKAKNFDLIVGIGEVFEHDACSVHCHEINVPVEELKNILNQHNISIVYIKGSRYMKMERYIKSLEVSVV